MICFIKKVELSYQVFNLWSSYYHRKKYEAYEEESRKQKTRKIMVGRLIDDDFSTKILDWIEKSGILGEAKS